jgi:hypothetical protein
LSAYGGVPPVALALIVTFTGAAPEDAQTVRANFGIRTTEVADGGRPENFQLQWPQPPTIIVSFVAASYAMASLSTGGGEKSGERDSHELFQNAHVSFTPP